MLLVSMENIEMGEYPDEIDGAPVSVVRKKAGNKDGVANSDPDATAHSTLIEQRNGTNGAQTSSAHEAEAQESGKGSIKWLKEELNKNVFWKIKLWMIIIFIFLVIIAIIFISLAICAAIHVDEDDIFDPSSFTFPRYFNGSFKMPNQLFTVDLATISSSKGQALAAELETKLTDLYKSSPALGRYFSEAEIYAFRNGSVIADYKLTFRLPEEKDQLRNFTLSREMVYNVFRQFLYDQDSLESEPMFIECDSLKMASGQ